ncbi:MAG: endo-1,4-beta-xylanase [Planctomycetota bacterium]
MLQFAVYDQDGLPPDDWPLRNAYLIGADGSPLRAEIAYEEQRIVCDKREPGTAALFLQHDARDLGCVTLQTCLLPERNEPYLLTLELARHRLMVLYTRLEEWSMFDLPADHRVPKRAERARGLFIEALCLQRSDPVQASRVAQECLASALDGSEELALAHSELLLNRRRETQAIPDHPFGVGLAPASVQVPEPAEPRLRSTLATNFDVMHLAVPWRRLCPQENEYDWSLTDRWLDWAQEAGVPVVMGPLVSFDPLNLPDWLYIWEHDYDTVRDVIYEHLERVIDRYAGVVFGWNVLSGLHINQHFTFNFEQLMDLTRMVLMLTRKLHPQGQLFVELRQPFGEYYATNQRSIPPLIYADLLAQSGVNFDAYLLRMPMGQAVPGQFTRDLMQFSVLLEQYAVFGKPIHLTCAAPSQPVSSVMIADPKEEQPVDADCGFWRRPWSPTVQSHWLEAICQVAMSKPYIESIVWQDFVDHPTMELPLSGLISENLQVRDALRRLVGFRRTLLNQPGPEGLEDTQNEPPSDINSDSRMGDKVRAPV